MTLIEPPQPLCEAEPPVLADYVIALLKNEAPIPEMHVTCERELLDFLQEHTKVILQCIRLARDGIAY
jgi:RNA-binding protein 26